MLFILYNSKPLLLSSDTVNLRIEEIRNCVSPTILAADVSMTDAAHVRLHPSATNSSLYAASTMLVLLSHQAQQRRARGRHRDYDLFASIAILAAQNIRASIHASLPFSAPLRSYLVHKLTMTGVATGNHFDGPHKRLQCLEWKR